jgi:pyruvate dehydrogenase E2 component (dihydrolipoamide acetyltransferase)
MASKITMPKLSDTMTEGVLVKWHKKEGEKVEAGQVIADAESDKATMELEAFDAGIMLKILVPEGGKVAVGGNLAIIGEKGEDIAALLSENAPAAPAVAPASAPEKPLPAAPVPDILAKDEIITSDALRIKASPLARKIAVERNINLRKLSGSGTGGRIVRRDIDGYLSKSPASAPAFTALPPGRAETEQILNTMRTAIAQRMTLSKTTVPHFYLTVDVDMDKAVAIRQELNGAQSEIKISFTDLIVKAAAMTLQKHPRVNGSFANDRFLLHGRVDIGLAVALEDGLITPVLRDCAARSVIEIAKEARGLIEKAKERKLNPAEYTGSTFTISNLGMYDIEEFSAIINPPEAAILAIAAIVEKPVVKAGQIRIGNRMKMTLSCDHRIVDGAAGALFLRDLKQTLEHPISLFL